MLITASARLSGSSGVVQPDPRPDMPCSPTRSTAGRSRSILPSATRRGNARGQPVAACHRSAHAPGSQCMTLRSSTAPGTPLSCSRPPSARHGSTGGPAPPTFCPARPCGACPCRCRGTQCTPGGRTSGRGIRGSGSHSPHRPNARRGTRHGRSAHRRQRQRARYNHCAKSPGRKYDATIVSTSCGTTRHSRATNSPRGTVPRQDLVDGAAEGWSIHAVQLIPHSVQRVDHLVQRDTRQQDHLHPAAFLRRPLGGIKRDHVSRAVRCPLDAVAVAAMVGRPPRGLRMHDVARGPPPSRAPVTLDRLPTLSNCRRHRECAGSPAHGRR